VNPLFTASFTIFLIEELLRHLGSELGIIRLNSLKLRINRIRTLDMLPAGILVAMTLRVEQKYLQEMQCCFQTNQTNTVGTS
jgi:hypothetical protein